MTTTGSDVALERLKKLHPKLIDLSLERIQRLLHSLGNPEQHLPSVVHVAGTNGKGSVIAMMRAIIEASGKFCHVYTSPHLIRFHERIRITGTLIDENYLITLLQECEEANAGGPITIFEITTAAAFLAFSRTPADFVLLETGLGGRLDATNLVPKPKLTVITPVSLDHQDFLGNEISKIAKEKAGILKHGVPCILSRQEKGARAVIIKKAEELSVPLLEQGVDWNVYSKKDYLVFENGQGKTKFPHPNLKGGHQFDNAGIALAALAALGDFSPACVDIVEGIQAIDWPARLQQITCGPLVEALKDGWELWLDGGHNAAASQSIVQHIDASWADRELHIICGMINSKKANAFLSPLEAKAHSLWTVAIPGEENSFSSRELAQQVNAAARAASSVSDALNRIIAANPYSGRILICGSLYLAGKVLAENA